MGWLPVVGLLVGFFVVYASQWTIPPGVAPYLSLAALAGVDSICGGIRAGIEGKFHDDIFLTGFFMNTVLAGLLAYLGDRIGVDLFLAAVVVLGGRVFLNLSLIRRYWLTQVALSRTKKEG
uniref:Small basic protein Sbp n=1 Tax=uncultured Armatimonadetes bacterium TaxID=157466 RepID=A0A6J4IUJ6_9BACT|nr:Small basic protein Sbp [uncultured Armatimonadetes bacterium]